MPNGRSLSKQRTLVLGAGWQHADRLLVLLLDIFQLLNDDWELLGDALSWHRPKLCCNQTILAV